MSRSADKEDFGLIAVFFPELAGNRESRVDMSAGSPGCKQNFQKRSLLFQNTFQFFLSLASREMASMIPISNSSISNEVPP